MVEKEWISIPVVVDKVELMGRCVCGNCWKNRDFICACGIKFSSTLDGCPACGRPMWCKS